MSTAAAAKSKTKSKAAGGSGATGGGDALTRVQALQHALASSTDLNPLTDLLDLARSLAGPTAGAAPKALDRALLVLGQALASLVSGKDRRVLLYPDQVDADGNLTSAALPRSIAASLSKAELQVSEWVKDQWNETVHLFCALTAHSDEGIRTTALRQLFVLQLAASNALSAASAAGNDADGADGEVKGARWAPSPWRALVLALTAGAPTSLEPTLPLRRKASVHADLHGTFLDELAEKYDDARFAFLRELRSILSNPPTSATASHDALRSNALQPLLFLTAIPTEEDHLNAFYVPAIGKAGGKKKKKSAKKNKSQKDGGDMDGSDDEAGPAEDMQDWFSDSDDEGTSSTRPGKQAGSSSATAGLGSAAREQRAKRKRKSVLPFSEGVHSLPAQKGAFANAWLALMLPRAVPVSTKGKASTLLSGQTRPLGGSLTVAQTHQILLVLHSQILPHFTRPNLVHEFLVDCLNSGNTDAKQIFLGAQDGSMEHVADASGANAATALLALHGLYVLIIQHNLDYPDFFLRLYTLLAYTPHLLHMRYRSRFLRLLETFLGSTLLPAALVASFAKRLSRMALRASPAAAVSVIPLVWNLLKRHKNCLTLIHREFDGDRLALGPAGIEDPFDALEPDPLKTRALESSLWELAALGAQQAALQRQGISASGSGGEAHFHHATSTLSRILAEPFLKERYDLDDFLDITYGTLFENESARVLPPPPAAKGEDAEGNKAPRKPKTIPTPVVRASLGDVELERYERERAALKEQEQRARKEVAPEAAAAAGEEGGANAEVDDADAQPIGTGASASTSVAAKVQPTLSFRGFATANVRAKRRKLAAAAAAGAQAHEGGDADDVMDLWLF